MSGTNVVKDESAATSGSGLEPVVMLQLPKGMQRMESSPVKFGDDWTGIFIRGDEAANLALCIDSAADAYMNENPITAISLKGYAKFLRSCIET